MSWLWERFFNTVRLCQFCTNRTVRLRSNLPYPLCWHCPRHPSPRSNCKADWSFTKKKSYTKLKSTIYGLDDGTTLATKHTHGFQVPSQKYSTTRQYVSRNHQPRSSSIVANHSPRFSSQRSQRCLFAQPTPGPQPRFRIWPGRRLSGMDKTQHAIGWNARTRQLIKRDI